MKIDTWLTFDDSNIGLNWITEKKLDYYTDIYNPGQIKQKLKIWREVEWGGWNTKTLIFDRLASVWTWNQDFTWFWFTPTSYSIKITYKWNSWANWPMFWWGWRDETWLNYATWIQWTTTSTNWPSTVSWTYVARIISNSSSNRTSMYHNAFLSDWVQLNVNFSDLDVILEITCFW